MENKLDSIVAELTAHDTAICDDIRDPKRVRMDAEYVNMVRHKGITIETICMMLTDAMESSSRLRAEKAQAKPPCNDPVLKATIEDCEAFPGGSAHFSTDMICGYLRELRSLRGIVDKLPVSKDGVVMIPGEAVWHHESNGSRMKVCPMSEAFWEWYKEVHKVDLPETERWVAWHCYDEADVGYHESSIELVSNCYSTFKAQEAAEQALREAGK